MGCNDEEEDKGDLSISEKVGVALLYTFLSGIIFFSLAYLLISHYF